MATRSLNVTITGDSRGIGVAARQADGHLKVVQRSAKLTGAAVKAGFAVAAGGAIVGIAAFKSTAKAAADAEVSQRRLQAQLRASGISYRAHAKEIDGVIQKTSRLSGLDDEDLQDAFTNIIRVTGNVTQSMRLTGLAADFARAKHIDVAKAGEIVGKVAGGNIGILSRYGIQIDKGASSTEALGKLQQRFAGQAKAYGDSAAGSQDRFGVAVENLQEKLGAHLLPALGKVANTVARFLDGMDRGVGAGGRFAGAISNAASVLRSAFGGAVKAVHGFLDRNRDDIHSVEKAVT
jgi:hypothetical protein